MIKYERVVVCSDLHVPYHDEECLSAFLSFCKFFKPHKVFINGDLIDFYAISRFTKDPKRELELQEEIDESVSVLKQIRKVNPNADIHFIKGNHCARLQKYLWSEAKALSGLRSLTVPGLLQLGTLKIKYYENGRMDYHGLLIKHGSVIRKFSGYTAKAEVEKNGKSGISGHTHRLGLYFQNNAGQEIVWAEGGCMCKLDAEYLEGEVPNWQQGWLVGHFKNNSPRYNLTLIPFIHGKAMYDGKEFK